MYSPYTPRYLSQGITPCSRGDLSAMTCSRQKDLFDLFWDDQVRFVKKKNPGNVFREHERKPNSLLHNIAKCDSVKQLSASSPHLRKDHSSVGGVMLVRNNPILTREAIRM
jgi:hypothetical protein